MQESINVNKNFNKFWSKIGNRIKNRNLYRLVREIFETR